VARVCRLFLNLSIIIRGRRRIPIKAALNSWPSSALANRCASHTCTNHIHISEIQSASHHLILPPPPHPSPGRTKTATRRESGSLKTTAQSGTYLMNGGLWEALGSSHANKEFVGSHYASRHVNKVRWGGGGVTERGRSYRQANGFHYKVSCAPAGQSCPSFSHRCCRFPGSIDGGDRGGGERRRRESIRPFVDSSALTEN
jgi:hypothetical protein